VRGGARRLGGLPIFKNFLYNFQRMKRFLIFIFFTLTLSCYKKAVNFYEIFPTYWKSILCSQVEIKDEWAYPLNIKNLFEKDKDEWVFCFVELRNVYSRHSLLWKWFKNGELYKKSQEVIISAQESRKNVVAWDKIHLDNTVEKGKWTVVILMDGKSVDRKDFEIK